VSPGRAPQVDTRRVVSPIANAIVLDILSDPAARMPGFGFETPFDFPFPVAVKTGTSRHFTDNWAVGTTRGFTVGVWAGNFNGHPMEGVSGVTGAGPLLHRAVMAVARRVPPAALTTPAEVGAVSVPVCRLSGMRATSHCAKIDEWFVRGTEPARDDDWERDGRIQLPAEFAEWATSARSPAVVGPARVEMASRVAGPRDEHADSVQSFHIVSPTDGDRYSVPPGVEAKYATIPLRAAGPGADRVEWIVDGKTYSGARWTLAPGAHVISAKPTHGMAASVRVTVDR
jgi:penicillin-binding protein 1C